MNDKILFIWLFIIVISCQSRNQFVTEDASSDTTTVVFENKISEGSQDSVYKVPDVLASFFGGETERVRFFDENLIYPSSGIESDEELVVFVSFVVEVDGTASNISIMRGIDENFDKEAIRLIKLAKWAPGKVNNNPVRSEFAIPVLFRKEGK